LSQREPTANTAPSLASSQCIESDTDIDSVNGDEVGMSGDTLALGGKCPDSGHLPRLEKLPPYTTSSALVRARKIFQEII
jgi:hypothetical protein